MLHPVFPPLFLFFFLKCLVLFVYYLFFIYLQNGCNKDMTSKPNHGGMERYERTIKVHLNSSFNSIKLGESSDIKVRIKANQY